MLIYAFSGVRFINPDVLVTTSIDQRMVVWQIVDRPSPDATPDGGIPSLKRLACLPHSVADVSSLRVYHSRSVISLWTCHDNHSIALHVYLKFVLQVDI